MLETVIGAKFCKTPYEDVSTAGLLVILREVAPAGILDSEQTVECQYEQQAGITLKLS